MTRDWDLIRALLLKLEQKPDSQGFVHLNALPAWDEDTVSYHIRLLSQAGLIEATCKESNQAKVFCLAINLTWDGHELLDSVRNDNAWNNIRFILKQQGLALSYEAIKAVAQALLKTLAL